MKRFAFLLGALSMFAAVGLVACGPSAQEAAPPADTTTTPEAVPDAATPEATPAETPATP